MRITKTVLASTLSLLLAVSLVGCNKPKPDTRVAATVNGTDILEADITARIEYLRNDPYFGYYDDISWATLLYSKDLTPETLRENIIRNDFAFFVLLLQKAEAAGITPNKELIDKEIADAKSSAASAGESFDVYLSRFGLASEAAYRSVLEADNIKNEVAEKMIQQSPSQAEIDTYISENAAEFAGRYLWLIAFTVDDEDPEKTAEACRTQAENAYLELMGGASFESVAEKYMKGTDWEAVGNRGGELGWGIDVLLPLEVQEALDNLAINTVSDIIEITEEDYSAITEEEEEEEEEEEGEEEEGEAENGKENEKEIARKTTAFFIVRYTEALLLTEDELDKPVEISKVPASVVKFLTEEFVAEKKAEYQNQFFMDIANSKEIVINEMPSGLSYDVDMALALIDDGTEEEKEEEETEEQKWDNPFIQDEFPDAEYADNGLGTSDGFVGTGAEVKNGDVVEAHYVGFLADGTMFDNSFIRGSGPYKFTVGAGSVIKGWDLGLVGMKVGGHRMLVIPSDLAYGSSGSGDIPPHSILIFFIELVSVNGDSTGYPAVRE